MLVSAEEPVEGSYELTGAFDGRQVVAIGDYRQGASPEAGGGVPCLGLREYPGTRLPTTSVKPSRKGSRPPAPHVGPPGSPGRGARSIGLPGSPARAPACTAPPTTLLGGLWGARRAASLSPGPLVSAGPRPPQERSRLADARKVDGGERRVDRASETGASI